MLPQHHQPPATTIFGKNCENIVYALLIASIVRQGFDDDTRVLGLFEFVFVRVFD